MSKTRLRGRPRDRSPKPPLVPVTFKADAPTLEAIEEITEDARRQGVLGRAQSHAIRAAIKEKAERLAAGRQ